MDHHDAQRHLIDFVDGRLDQRARDELNAHVESCIDCRSWLETHELLACAFDSGPGAGHPDSELLALCAIRPEEIDEPGRSEIGRHLEACAHCRRDVELVRDAVLEVRPKGSVPARLTRTLPAAPWLAVAAAICIVGVALWLSLPFATNRPILPDSRSYDIATHVETSRSSPMGSPREALEEMELEGTQFIEAEGRLTLSRVKIKDGAKVTINAGEGVAFGDGFQIGSGAVVAIGAKTRHTKSASVETGEQG